MAAFVFTLVIAFGVFHTVRVTRERNHAQQEAAQRREITEFLVDLFRASDPEHSQGKDITAGELLQYGAERIDNELADQPETRTRLLAVVGEVSRNIGLYDEARSRLE